MLPSKLAAAAGLQILGVLQSLPPNTLSAKAGDRAKDKYFKAGSITTEKAIGLSLAITGLIPFLHSYTSGGQVLQQPWETADVLYAALGVAGAALRLWAMRVLARHFTFEVGIVKDHKYDFPFLVPVPNELPIAQFSAFARLVQSGPYRLIRHPGYTGGIISGLGTVGFMGLRPPGLAWSMLVALPLTLFMVARISNEEQTLHQHFGKQWEDYCKRTWRLFPPLL